MIVIKINSVIKSRDLFNEIIILSLSRKCNQVVKKKKKYNIY